MKSKLSRTLAVLLAGFLVLFLGRLLYLHHLSKKFDSLGPSVITSLGLPSYDFFMPGAAQEPQFFAGKDIATRTSTATFNNYAKERYKVIPGEGFPTAAKPIPAESTYEKVASLSSNTRDFDSDEKKLRSIIQTHKILVQQEKGEGLKGTRTLDLTLGVLPENFEAVVTEIKKLGRLLSFQVTKADKTGDYKGLMVQRAALEKNKADLAALKARGGKVSELLGLQETLFGIQDQMEELGLALNPFETPTGLCTVLFTLSESGPGLSFGTLVKASFQWALWKYFVFLSFLFLGAIASWVLLRFLGKLKTFPAVILEKWNGSAKGGARRTSTVQGSGFTKESLVLGFKLFLAVFLLLFLGRWVQLQRESNKSQTYVAPPVYQPIVVESKAIQYQYSGLVEGDEDSDRSDNVQNKGVGANIALHNLAKEKSPVSAQESAYEKIAAAAARTRDFEKDETKIRGLITSNNALVQQEKNEGLTGARLLNLTVGVPPGNFDPFVENLRKVGDLASFSVTKTDKTSDYASLRAKRATLERNKAELVALKSGAGKMADWIKLQTRIFDIERQIRESGLEIGQFEGPTGLCTVLLAFKELGPTPPLWWTGAQAFGWTMGTCSGWLFVLFSGSLLGLFLLWAIGKATPLTQTNRKEFKDTKGALERFFRPIPPKGRR